MDHRTFEEVNALVARNQAEGDAAEAGAERHSEASVPADSETVKSNASTMDAEALSQGSDASDVTTAAPVKPPVQAGESALATYRRNAQKFTLIGGVGCACGLLVLLTVRKQNSPLMILAALVMLGGALILVTGLSALRSDGMVRAFAQVAAMQPTTAQMQDLLDAMKNVGFSGLAPAVKQQILTAVSRYRGYEGYDVALADRIEEIATHARKRSVL